MTSTLVMGWILPVATTERATSPRVTLASWLGSMCGALDQARQANTPATTTTSTAAESSQIQNRLLFRDAATRDPPRAMREPHRSEYKHDAID